ncbi:MAG: glycoside hydrolase family 2 TIM barrel-domain containing protein [Deinococcales bacterium]
MLYPRPQHRRKDWQNLDGIWHYAFDEGQNPASIRWQGDINVPFAPEAKLSGVHDEGYHPVIWYERSFSLPQAWQNKRIILHFGAVDYEAKVWVNGQHVISHEGGHTPFKVDITEALKVEGDQVITVRAADDPLDMSKPRGKQEWQEKPHAIWYPRTTGIWQTVWLEPLSPHHLSKLRLTPSLSNFSFHSIFEIAGDLSNLKNPQLDITFSHKGQTLAQDSLHVTAASLERNIQLSVNGFDDLRQYVWSPEHPNLIDIHLKLLDGETVLDEVTSYTALRSFEVRQGKFFLNNHPYYLRLALDQGYWDDGLLTAPSSEALAEDVKLAKSMGFNGVRKHQKIEDPRYLYAADTLGLLVWEEMPSAYHFNEKAVKRLTQEWLEVIERDYNHPCIMTWVCFNESWGMPDLVHDPRQRAYISALYHLTKSLDSSRLVIGNDGWEHMESDLFTVHDYQRDAEVLKERYGTKEGLADIETRILEHGRLSLLQESPIRNEAIILSEFGGIRFNPHAEGWGYQQVDSAEKLLDLYARMVTSIEGAGLAGFCYTQFADTFQEQNGLLYSNRQPKVALADLAKATRNGR